MLQGKRGLLGNSTWRKSMLFMRNRSLYQGLVSFWNLDGATGASRTDSHGSNTLTNNNNVSLVAGRVGDASQFTAASSQYLSIASNALLQTGNISWTFTAWVYVDSFAESWVIGKDNAAANGLEYLLGYSNGVGRFRVYIGNAAGTNDVVDANNFGAPSTGTWYWLAAWRDLAANTINISVNDGAANSTTMTITPAVGTSAFSIGRDGEFNGQYWNGRIDAVGFWKRVLNADERTLLYNGGNGREYPF